jgi:protoporphyrinogen oxidase
MAIAEKDYDVAIVGCGVSGVYAGWRLLKSPSVAEPVKRFAEQRPSGSLRVGLFEYSNRIGGRLLSSQLPGDSNLSFEFGGMRFLNSHSRVWGLVHRFSFEKTRLRVGDPKGRSMCYLRLRMCFFK